MCSVVWEVHAPPVMAWRRGEQGWCFSPQMQARNSKPPHRGGGEDMAELPAAKLSAKFLNSVEGIGDVVRVRESGIDRLWGNVGQASVRRAAAVLRCMASP